MRRPTPFVLFAVATVAASAGTAAAQATSARSFSVGVSGGVSLPVGDFGEGFKSGFNVGANLGFMPAALPFGVRLEGQFNRFDPESSNSAADYNFDVYSGTVNAIFGAPATSGAFRPYIIGGVGVYRLKSSGSTSVGGTTIESSASTNDLGLNAGAGIEFGLSGLSTFVEARFNSVFTEGGNTSYVPLVFGIKF